MHTKNLYENGPNPFVFFGTKNMSEGHLMHTVLVCYVFDKLGQACLCGRGTAMKLPNGNGHQLFKTSG